MFSTLATVANSEAVENGCVAAEAKLVGISNIRDVSGVVISHGSNFSLTIYFLMLWRKCHGFLISAPWPNVFPVSCVVIVLRFHNHTHSAGGCPSSAAAQYLQQAGVSV